MSSNTSLTMPMPPLLKKCFLNLTSNEKLEFLKKQKSLSLTSVQKLYFGWFPLPLAVFGLLMTSIYIITIFHAIRRRRVSRKCYLLLLNKALGDALCAVSAIFTSVYVLLATSISKEVMATLETFFIGSFWSATVSFISISIIKLYAVWRPLEYRRTFTMKKCKKLILISWLVFSVMAICTLFVNALVRVPTLKKWSKCDVETCLSRMYRIRNSFVVIMYGVTIATYIITVLLFRQVHRSSVSMKRKVSKKIDCRKTRFPMWKLSLNVGTFACLNIFYVLWSISILIQQNHCHFMLNLPEMMRLLGLIRLTLLLRVLIDPIIGFIIDMQLRRRVLYWSGLRSRSVNISPQGSQKTVITERLSESDSKSFNTVTQRCTIATINSL